MLSNAYQPGLSVCKDLFDSVVNLPTCSTPISSVQLDVNDLTSQILPRLLYHFLNCFSNL